MNTRLANTSEQFLGKLTQELRSVIGVNEIITGPQDRTSLIAYKAILTDDYPIKEIDKIITTHAPACFDEYGFNAEIFSMTLFGNKGLEDLKDSMALFLIDNFYSIISIKEFFNKKRGGLVCECVGEKTEQSMVIAMSWLHITPADLVRFSDDEHLSKVKQGGHLFTCSVLWENEP